MSHKATNWLASMDPKALTDGEFRVLFALADCHNPSRGCFPKQAHLIQATGKGSSSVNRALNGLEEKGLIKRERRHNPTNRQREATHYILGCDEDLAQGPSPDNGDGAISHLCANPSPDFAQSHLPISGVVYNEEPVKEPVREPVNTPHTPQGGQVEIFKPVQDGSASKQKIAGGLHPNCADLDQEFEMVWSAYPRKVGKGAAKKFWLRIRRKETFETVAGPLGQFIRNSRGTDINMIPHLRTWLSQERWGDEQTHATNRQQNSDDQLNGLMGVQTSDQQLDGLFSGGMQQIEGSPV